MTPWQALKTNDRIDIIAPASGRPREIINQAVSVLRTWGLNPVVPDDLLGKTLFSSNTLERRFAHLQAALLNPDSKLIWSLRGGYGSAQLIPLLEKMPKPNMQKWIMGFSDITALHLFFQNHWGWPTIHGPQAASMVDVLDAESVSVLKSFLTNPQNNISFSDVVPMNAAARNTQTIVASITGGNLSLLQTSIGTSWQLNSRDKIVLIEDINERAYRVDRTLLHLVQSCVLNGAKAILLGDFSDCEEVLINTVLQQFADAQNIPVLRIAHIGHGKSNWPIIFGMAARLEMNSKNGQLIIEN